MTLSQRYEAILNYFRTNVPVAESELHFDSAYQLLVAVMLSAQCTDRRVNMVTPQLFERFPSAFELAKSTAEEILPYIKSISYPNSKAGHLSGMARRLVEAYGGEVPSSFEDLMTLPGVGRKTANVVASIIYNEPVIAVDTHVFRVARRLGLSKGSTPEDVERELESHVPEDIRPIAHHWLILHGRYVCTARAPKCSECPLTEFCADFSKRR